MNRRVFVTLMIVAGATPSVIADSLVRLRRKNTDPAATSKYIFQQTVKSIQKQKLQHLPIGELINHIGMMLIGTPYVGGTLEGDGPEVCRIDFTGLDCVTFFENCLDTARIIKKGKHSYDDLFKEVTFTRYRSGTLVDYASRLHYTSEWIADNIVKGVVADATPATHALPFVLHVGFMSSHPQYYPALKADSNFTRVIASIEDRVNTTKRTFIPKTAIADIEDQLQSGDIIAITTSKDGLDYSHTGLISKGADGTARFLHASTQKKKVVLDESISSYVNSVKAHTGISVARPLEI